MEKGCGSLQPLPQTNRIEGNGGRPCGGGYSFLPYSTSMRTARNQSQAEHFHKNARSTKSHARLVALPNTARSCSARTPYFLSSPRCIPLLWLRRTCPWVCTRDSSSPNIDNSLTSVARFKANLHLRSWELSPEPATFATSNKWSNKDMDPGECSPTTRVGR